jgi:hypothetical protein
VKVVQLLHGLGLNGKIKTQKERISYIFPQLDFCTFFGVTIKNTWTKGKKYSIMSPNACIFSQVSQNL